MKEAKNIISLPVLSTLTMNKVLVRVWLLFQSVFTVLVIFIVMRHVFACLKTVGTQIDLETIKFSLFHVFMFDLKVFLHQPKKIDENK